MGAGLTACGSGSSMSAAASDAVPLSLWYWSGGLSDQAVTEVATTFAGRAVISPTVVAGDFKQHLMSALTSGRSVPDVSGVKGEDMPVFLTQPDYFLDLNTLGAADLAGTFAAAKYAQATTLDGRQLGLPIDLGPTALFFRKDLWAKAGLPSDPDEVGDLTQSWDGWFEVAARLRKKLPGSYAIRSGADIFDVALAQQPETFLSRDGTFVGDSGGVKLAWELAVRSITEGLQAGIYDGSAFNAALSTGQLTGHIGPAWNGLDIEDGAPATSGSWRVAPTPGGPANIGGSFLTLTSSCRSPELAFAYITEMLSPENQSRGFTDASLFPAVTAAYDLPALTRGQDFYGGQATIEVFGPAAEQLPTVYVAPNNGAIAATYNTELSNVEGGKDASRAWDDAVAAGSLMV